MKDDDVGGVMGHACVRKTSKYTMLLHLEYTDTPGTDGSAWRGNTYIRDKKQDLFTFPELWFRQRETRPRSVVFFNISFYSSSKFYLFW
jgi:hypothetical protein